MCLIIGAAFLRETLETQTDQAHKTSEIEPSEEKATIHLAIADLKVLAQQVRVLPRVYNYS